MISNKKAVAETPQYKCTPEEDAATDRLVNGSQSIGLKVVERGGVRRTVIDHADHVVGAAMLAEALGTNDPVFLNGLLGQLGRAASGGETYARTR